VSTTISLDRIDKYDKVSRNLNGRTVRNCFDIESNMLPARCKVTRLARCPGSLRSWRRQYKCQQAQNSAIIEIWKRSMTHLDD
jgi:hypothetical protein